MSWYPGKYISKLFQFEQKGTQPVIVKGDEREMKRQILEIFKKELTTVKHLFETMKRASRSDVDVNIDYHEVELPGGFGEPPKVEIVYKLEAKPKNPLNETGIRIASIYIYTRVPEVSVGGYTLDFSKIQKYSIVISEKFLWRPDQEYLKKVLAEGDIVEIQSGKIDVLYKGEAAITIDLRNIHEAEYRLETVCEEYRGTRCFKAYVVGQFRIETTPSLFIISKERIPMILIGEELKR